MWLPCESSCGLRAADRTRGAFAADSESQQLLASMLGMRGLISWTYKR